MLVAHIKGKGFTASVYLAVHPPMYSALVNLWRNPWNWLVALAAGGWFGFNVWPTPYSTYEYQGSTIRESRFLNQCQAVKTPNGWHTIGVDGRCFLPSEVNRTPGTYEIPADKAVTNPDAISKEFDQTIVKDTPDLGLERQAYVISQLSVSITLARDYPRLKIINHSRCTLNNITLEIPTIKRDRYVGYNADLGSLLPGETYEDYISLREFPYRPDITTSSVVFDDPASTVFADSPCAHSP